MSTTHYRTLLEPVIDLARDAGRRIMDVYHQTGRFDITHKQDSTPLTEADIAAHTAIDAGLSILDPTIPVLSEESAEIPFSERQTWECYWLVDPLDGTREFIKRNGEFTVNIALIEQHQAVLGVVYVPVSGLCYFAVRGQGAYKQPANAPAQRIQARPWNGGTLTVVGSRSHAGPSLQGFLGRLPDYELISMGSALKSCLVAEGQADIYPRFGPTSEWDTAAAQCVVEEAGGALTDTHLQPLFYNTKASLINPDFLVFGDRSYDWSKYLL
jgi:3'(2'), 5'-bisphosphate nucleotidase